MYKKEDMKFLNMKTTRKYVINATSKNGFYEIFEIEHNLTIEEKIKFIDEIENGVASYLLNIFNKWENEKDSLPKNNYGGIKTVSKKAWIKRNDKRKIINIDYKIGRYYLFGTEFRATLICSNTEYGYNMAYTGDNVVNQWFHDLCRKLYNEERKYFQSINPINIKISQLKEYAGRYHIYFDSGKVNDIAWNGDKNVTEKELDIYLDAYNKIENYVKDITKEVQQQINNLDAKEETTQCK